MKRGCKLMTQAFDAHGKPYKRSLLILVLLIGSFCTVFNHGLSYFNEGLRYQYLDCAMAHDWFLDGQRDHDSH